MPINFNDIDPIVLISVGSAFVCFLSMLISIMQNVKQKKRIRNTVRPISSIVVNDFKDKFSVRLDNIGTGTLIIEKFGIKTEDKTFSDFSSLLSNVNCQLHYPAKTEGKTVPIGGNITLLEILPRDNNERLKIKKALSKATVTVKYTNIFDDEFSDSRVLEFLEENK